jgi:hypothetical protein
LREETYSVSGKKCGLPVSKLGKPGNWNEMFQHCSSANGTGSCGDQNGSWLTCREMAVEHCEVIQPVVVM